MLATRKPRTKVRNAFTLIELIMVLVIITALAALVIPVVDYIRRTSDKASASFVMAQLTEQIGTFRTLRGIYPDNFDSLLDEADQTFASTIAKTGKGVVSELTESEAKSMDKIGLDSVMDLDVDDSLGLTYRDRPGNSGVSPRAIATGEKVYVITNTDIAHSCYPEINLSDPAVASANGTLTMDTATGIITDSATGLTIKLVVLGVGPMNEMIGRTMASAPAYSGVTNPESKYNRFLAIFAVYDTSAAPFGYKRAQLKGCMDSTFDFLNQEINEVEENIIQ